jgi:hypothetical protein
MQTYDSAPPRIGKVLPDKPKPKRKKPAGIVKKAMRKAKGK